MLAKRSACSVFSPPMSIIFFGAGEQVRGSPSPTRNDSTFRRSLPSFAHVRPTVPCDDHRRKTAMLQTGCHRKEKNVQTSESFEIFSVLTLKMVFENEAIGSHAGNVFL